mmetsp:Transcript_35368/g.57906  ORF Transcript_35368/g.57906 Transcript_35368/m.57906 type:complete len:218 (+) Transcript_35368:471-1124(+)
MRLCLRVRLYRHHVTRWFICADRSGRSVSHGPIRVRHRTRLFCHSHLDAGRILQTVLLYGSVIVGHRRHSLLDWTVHVIQAKAQQHHQDREPRNHSQRTRNLPPIIKQVHAALLFKLAIGDTQKPAVCKIINNHIKSVKQRLYQTPNRLNIPLQRERNAIHIVIDIKHAVSIRFNPINLAVRIITQRKLNLYRSAGIDKRIQTCAGIKHGNVAPVWR